MGGLAFVVGVNFGPYMRGGISNRLLQMAITNDVFFDIAVQEVGDFPSYWISVGKIYVLKTETWPDVFRACNNSGSISVPSVRNIKSGICKSLDGQCKLP